LKIPDPGKNITKAQYRSQLAAEFGDTERLHTESKFGWEMLSLPSTVKALDRVFANLSKPKAKI
jgi:3,2-trans-enoyl-CoA isomerase